MTWTLQLNLTMTWPKTQQLNLSRVKSGVSWWCPAQCLELSDAGSSARYTGVKWAGQVTVAGGQLTQHDLGSLRSNGSWIRRRQLLNPGLKKITFLIVSLILKREKTIVGNLECFLLAVLLYSLRNSKENLYSQPHSLLWKFLLMITTPGENKRFPVDNFWLHPSIVVFSTMGHTKLKQSSQSRFSLSESYSRTPISEGISMMVEVKR